MAALAAITAARKLAAELEHGELAFIDAARSGGAAWSQIAAAMEPATARPLRNVMPTLHDAARVRHPWTCRPHRSPAGRKPSTTTAPRARVAPAPGTARHQTGQASPHRTGGRTSHCPQPSRPPQQPPRRLRPPAARGNSPCRRSPVTSSPRASTSSSGHPETRAWHVLAGGTRAGLVRPTWRGERSRPGWETVDNTGLPLPATGIGRVTPAGNARTRDAAAVSLLRALQHQQENEHKGQTLTMRTSTNRGHPCICQATIQLAEAELFREFQYLTVPLHLTAADARAALEKAGWLTGQEVSW